MEIKDYKGSKVLGGIASQVFGITQRGAMGGFINATQR